MSNNDTQWLTAADAGKILRVTSRQVHRYAEQGQLVTRRAGRRVLFSAESVAQLADELAVDVRPAPSQRQDLIPPEMVRYLQEQAEQMRQQGETQQSIDRRLAEIERQQQQTPPWVRNLYYLFALLIILFGVAFLVFFFGAR